MVLRVHLGYVRDLLPLGVPGFGAWCLTDLVPDEAGLLGSRCSSQV